MTYMGMRGSGDWKPGQVLRYKGKNYKMLDHETLYVLDSCFYAITLELIREVPKFNIWSFLYEEYLDTTLKVIAINTGVFNFFDFLYSINNTIIQLG